MSQEDTETRLLSLVFALREGVGGKHATFIPICSIRCGICPDNEDATCTNACSVKYNFEHPKPST